MFNSTILDMVVLLFFTYFITSLLVTVLNEMIATIRDMRAKQLQEALSTLFFDKGWGNYLQNYILSSPHYKSLIKTETSKPSYIPAENFAKAIIDSIRTGNQSLTITDVRNNLENAASPLPEGVKKILVGFLDTSTVTVEEMQAKIELFYNNAMDRATGWYKRKIKVISLIVSLALVIFLNIDTVEIIRKSTQNPAELKATADNIARAVPDMRIDTAGGKHILVFKDSTSRQPQTISLDSVGAAQLNTLMQQYKGFNTIKQNLNNSVYSVGYSSWQAVGDEWFHISTLKKSDDGIVNVLLVIGWFLLKVIGLCITVLALQAGSSYWFGALNKVINIRGTGAKPKDNSTNGK